MSAAAPFAFGGLRITVILCAYNIPPMVALRASPSYGKWIGHNLWNLGPRAFSKTLCSLERWPFPVWTALLNVLNTAWQDALLKQSRTFNESLVRNLTIVFVLGKIIITSLLLVQSMAVTKPTHPIPLLKDRRKK